MPGTGAPMHVRPLLPLPARLGGRRSRRRSASSAKAGLAFFLCLVVLLLTQALLASTVLSFVAADTSLQNGVGKQRNIAGVMTDLAGKLGGGFFSVALLCVAETIGILICMPGYSTIEYASGALFGFFRGSLLMALSKTVAAMIAYGLMYKLRDSPMGQWAKQRVMNSERGGTGLSKRLCKGIEQKGFTVCLLVRCSPVPAWLSNYALPLAGVPFTTYLPASVIGMLPPVLTNVYAGAALVQLGSALSGNSTAGGSFNFVGPLAVAVSIVSSTILVHQLKSSSLDEADLAEEASLGFPASDNELGDRSE